MARIAPSSSSKKTHYRGPSAGRSNDDSNSSSLLHQILNAPPVKIVGNLADDIKDTVIGIPTGAVNLVVHPEQSVVAMGKGLWADWAPLFEGDPGKFAKNFYDHPLAPILDVASVLTLGAGGVARGAKVLSEAGVLADTRVVEALARPTLMRKLESGRLPGDKAVVEHHKAYNANPIIRARQITTEKAVNGLASLVPSWFKGDPALAAERVAGFSGAERADAWRWYKADKYDEASRAHATAAAGQLAIGAIMAASKRLHDAPVATAKTFMPHIIENLETHAHLVKEGDLPDPLFRNMTDKERAQAMAAAEREFKASQKAPGTDLVKYDEATARAGAEGGPITDSYGFEERDIAHKGARTIDTSKYRFVDKNAQAKVDEFFARNPNLTGQQLADFISSKGEFSGGKGLGGKLVTKDWRQAKRDADGNFLVARNHSKYLQEAGNSTHFLAQVAKKPLTLWKWAILGLRPAYFVNNAVGNYTMYLLSQGGPDAIRGLMDARRQLHSQGMLTKEMSRVERRFFRSSFDWQDKYYLGLHRGFSQDASDWLAGQNSKIKVAPGVTGRFKKVAGTGLYDVTHVYTDRVIRRAAINNILRKNPDVKRLMKQGHSFDDAAASVSENRALRESVQEQVNNILGQYHYLNPAERIVRAVVPFYTWDRAIVRHGAHLYLDKPTTAAVVTQLGAQGVQTTEQLLGEVPDFLKGALPLSMVGLPESVDGRVPILGTQGLNPYASLRSVIEAGQALTTGGVPAGEVFASQLNPFITGAIEQTTGTNLLSGKQLPQGATEGGLITNILADTAMNLPQVKVEESLRGKVYRSPDTLYKNDPLQFIYSYLGLPAKQMNPEAAAKLAEERDGVTTSKKKYRRKRKG
jgi:hypothetical protein